MDAGRSGAIAAMVALMKIFLVTHTSSSFGHVHCLQISNCAVVFSSGRLSLGRHGSIIHTFPAVIRFHDSPVKSFEGIAGSTTTMRVLSTIWSQYTVLENLAQDLVRLQDNNTMHLLLRSRGRHDVNGWCKQVSNDTHDFSKDCVL